jgi:hypothetical protein
MFVSTVLCVPSAMESAGHNVILLQCGTVWTLISPLKDIKSVYASYCLSPIMTLMHMFMHKQVHFHSCGFCGGFCGGFGGDFEL